MKKVLAAGLLAIGLSSAQGSFANATPISVGSGWNQFGFGDVGSSWDDDFTFTLTSSAVLKVTDAFLSGDRFLVTDTFDVLPGLPLTLPIGITSKPTIGYDVGNNFDAAYASPFFSHASFLLGPGTYDISGFVLKSPYGGGGAAVELVSAVPLPASAPMFGAGLVVIGAAGYAAKRKKAVVRA